MHWWHHRASRHRTLMSKIHYPFQGYGKTSKNGSYKLWILKPRKNQPCKSSVCQTKRSSQIRALKLRSKMFKSWTRQNQVRRSSWKNSLMPKNLVRILEHSSFSDTDSSNESSQDERKANRKPKKKETYCCVYNGPHAGIKPKICYQLFCSGLVENIYPGKDLEELNYFPVNFKKAVRNFQKRALKNSSKKLFLSHL